MNSKSCSGWEGFIIGVASAWLDWQQETVLAAIDAWVAKGGMESVSSKVELEAGNAFFSAQPGLFDSLWLSIAENPVLQRSFRMAALESVSTLPGTMGKAEKAKLDEGTKILKDLAERLIATRVGKAVLLHPVFPERMKEIQKHRRLLRTVKQVHDL